MRRENLLRRKMENVSMEVKTRDWFDGLNEKEPTKKRRRTNRHLSN